MAGRPLTGSRWEAEGRFHFSCPRARGDRTRQQASFATAAERDAYADAALAALNDGRPLPDPDSLRVAPRWVSGRGAPSFGVVARAWYAGHHGGLRRSQADRAIAVQGMLENTLVPWFDSRTATIEELSQDLVIDFIVEHRRVPDPTVDDEPAGLPQTEGSGQQDDSAREWLSFREAAERCGCSLSTIKRAHAAGRLPSVRRDEQRRTRVMTVGDLKTAGLLDKQPRRGWCDGYLRNHLQVIEEVCAYGRGNGLAIPPITQDIRLATAASEGQSRPAVPLTLGECRRVATHLHVIWQVVFWLMRLVGLRIGEVFGLRVEDVLDLGDVGALHVHRQGGKTFRAYTADGSIVRTHSKNRTKTQPSERLVPVPGAILFVLRTVIRAFHTDPDTGEVDGKARLIPGMANADRGGYSAFETALRLALRAEKLSTQDMEFRVSPHHLRKSLTTDLAWTRELTDIARRRYVGHRPGGDVFARVYTLDHPSMGPLIEVADSVQRKIDEHLDGDVIVPTTVRFRLRKSNVLAQRQSHVDHTLADAGWIAHDGDEQDPLLSVVEVAAQLGVTPVSVRRWLNDGTLPCLPASHGDRRDLRNVRLSAVLAYQRQHLLPLQDAADKVGLTYHQAYALLRRLGRHPNASPRGRVFISPADEEAMTDEIERLQSLQSRSVRLSEAAKLLGVSHSTARALVARRELAVDPETDTSKAIFVPRTAITEYLNRSKVTRHSPASVPTNDVLGLLEVRALTGLTGLDIQALVRSGLLERHDTQGRWGITVTSLRRWATGYRPSLLDAIPLAAAS